MASTVTELLRRRFGGKALPYDAEIEYLENTGTQYIDVGIVLDADTTVIRIEFSASFSTYGSNSLVVARSEPTYGLEVYTYRNAIYNVNARGFFTLNTTHDFLAQSTDNKKTISVDGSLGEANNNVSISSGSSLYILGSPSFVANREALGKYYSFSIYRNDVLVRDLIPVRVGQVGYMYDKVSKQLFGNAGTGNFILGNDK